MSSVPERGGKRRRLAHRVASLLLLALIQAACVFSPAVTPSPSPSPTATASASLSPTPSPTATGPSQSSEPTATPEPPLSLAIPSRQDSRQVRVRVSPDVASDGGGQIVVTVTSRSERQVKELVLRWPTDLKATLFLAPFRPSEQRIAEFGPPLLQDWTKWVEGPGESGEPAGTTSLGWGPLLPGATLTIPLLVTRNQRGQVSFDLQVLAGESILSLENGSPAELRVTVP